jgi:hypothetical protein
MKGIWVFTWTASSQLPTFQQILLNSLRRLQVGIISLQISDNMYLVSMLQIAFKLPSRLPKVFRRPSKDNVNYA